jgi:hypothetical protein
VIKSFLSLGFLRPAKAILVPGMYFLGFSRYCSRDVASAQTLTPQHQEHPAATTHLEQGVLLPNDTLVNVGGGVRETVDLTRLSAEETVQCRSDLVGTSSFNGVALSTSGLEETGTLGRIT